MSAIKTERQERSRLRRREFVAGGVLGAAGLLAGASTSLAATDTTDWLTYQSAGPDGASVQYPANWVLDPSIDQDLSLDPYLLYPHQSFSLRTSASKPGDDLGPDGGGLPDLTGYPSDAAIVWLMDYDNGVEGASFGGVSLGALGQLIPSEFPAFQSYVGRFSNAVRSFLLRVWIGTSTPNNTASAIDACLRSISIP